jgi:hypothetical protein
MVEPLKNLTYGTGLANNVPQKKISVENAYIEYGKKKLVFINIVLLNRNY